MASFRTGFKIFGEISLKQGLGRIRSFSEDRKPGQWLPEDQWAVRQPGSTCSEQCCEKPTKKKVKPSKSWLSLCKDPEKPLDCDIRHNNCPPPPVKDDGPWYSLDNLIPKKKHEKLPPIQSCREEMKRKECCPDEEEVCENIVHKTLTIDVKPEPTEACGPKQEPSPAPVANLTCPLPKELNLMLWCGRPSKDTSRIAMACQSDRLPFQEFRPQKVWKAPPFSLPTRSDPTHTSPNCNVGCIPYSEFKQVEVPKPLYTRYKSVELRDSNFLLNMIDVKCTDNETIHTKAIKTFPNPKVCKNVETDKKKDAYPEKPVIAVGSVKPVRLKNAPKFEFRPKPTKLIEKRIPKNPYAKNETDLTSRPPEDSGESKLCETPPKSDEKEEKAKVITGTLTKEPQVFEANVPLPSSPPTWMYVLCKPGSKETPLVPNNDECPNEPDWSSETDGLNFYDKQDEQITPKPPPDPCLIETKKEAEGDKTEKKSESVSVPSPEKEVKDSAPVVKNRYVLMPEKFNIKLRAPEPPTQIEKSEPTTVEKFIESKTSDLKKNTKSSSAMKENILYDLQRMCLNVPFDPTKINAPCRKPPPPECPHPPKFYRGFSTFSPALIKNLNSDQLFKIQRRTECGDTSDKCKPRDLTPAPRECPEKPKPRECTEITLPCCPKSKVPPSCSTKKPMPPCKKRLAPKPSFSECSRDPPPCPKMTECNCWEKKPGKNNRKYSDWAAQRGDHNPMTEREEGN